jgi:hypothetical protein
MHQANRDGANVRVVVGIGAMAVVILLGLGLFFAFGESLRSPLPTTSSTTPLVE